MTARVRKGNFQNGLLSYCKRKKIGLKNKATSLYTRMEAYKNYVCFTNKGVLYLTNLSFLKLFCFQSVIIISNAQSSIFIHFLNCQTAVNSSTGSDLFLVFSFPAKQALWSSQWTSSCQTQWTHHNLYRVDINSLLDMEAYSLLLKVSPLLSFSIWLFPLFTLLLWIAFPGFLLHFHFSPKPPWVNIHRGSLFFSVFMFFMWALSQYPMFNYLLNKVIPKSLFPTWNFHQFSH